MLRDARAKWQADDISAGEWGQQILTSHATLSETSPAGIAKFEGVVAAGAAAGASGPTVFSDHAAHVFTEEFVAVRPTRSTLAPGTRWRGTAAGRRSYAYPYHAAHPQHADHQ